MMNTRQVQLFVQMLSYNDKYDPDVQAVGKASTVEGVPGEHVDDSEGGEEDDTALLRRLPVHQIDSCEFWVSGSSDVPQGLGSLKP